MNWIYLYFALALAYTFFANPDALGHLFGGLFVLVTWPFWAGVRAVNCVLRHMSA